MATHIEAAPATVIAASPETNGKGNAEESSEDSVAFKKMKLSSSALEPILLFIIKHNLHIHAVESSEGSTNGNSDCPGSREEAVIDISKYVPSSPIADAGDLAITSANSSADFKFICCSDNQKNVYIFARSPLSSSAQAQIQRQSWELFATLELKPRPLTDVQFDKQLTKLIMTDKSGHVYISSIQPNENNLIASPERILGHCSFITDTILSENEKFILTSDRDHKIRMSHFPDGHDIERFFLGHTDSVAFIKILKKDSILVSLAEKGNIIVWKWKPELEDWKPLPKIRFAQYTDSKIERVQIKTACAFMDHDEIIHVAFQCANGTGVRLRLDLRRPWTPESALESETFVTSESHQLVEFQNSFLQYDNETRVLTKIL